MTLFSFLTLAGGLALFLYGMNVMSGGLEKMAGSKLEQILRRMTSRRLKGLALGAGVTAVVQSSSAVTVMLVGLVNSGIMQLSQAISVVFGSNIGTTMTAWILSLAGLKSDSVWLQLLKPTSFSPVIALIGVGLIFLSKKQKRKDAGTICVGFAVLMFGMETMSGAVAPLAESPAFASLLTAFENPLLGLLAGALFTAVIQSSSASVGVLQALAMTGTISFRVALPIILSQNIGTCVSALIASVGTNRNARRVSVVHILFNVIGTALFLGGWLGADAISNFAFADTTITPLDIAMVHTIFNLTTAAVLFPFMGILERLARRIIKDAPAREESVLLDERLLTVPSFAVAKAMNTTVHMADLSRKAVLRATGLTRQYDARTADEVVEMEEQLDHYEDELGTYLVKVSKRELTDEDSRRTAMMLHTITDFERIGDHASNLLKVAGEMRDKRVAFSHEATRELSILTAAVEDILTLATQAFETNDSELAESVEPLEQVVDGLITEIKNRHVARLQSGNCSISFGFILNDLLTNYERISDHCSNVAVAVIEAERDSFDTHEYLQAVKAAKTGRYAEAYTRYCTRYTL